MFFIASFFLGVLFRPLIPGTEIIRGEEVPLYRSYISGCILLRNCSLYSNGSYVILPCPGE